MSSTTVQPVRHILLIKGNKKQHTIVLEAPVYSISYLDDTLSVSQRTRSESSSPATELASIVRRTNSKTNSCSFLLLCNQSRNRQARKGILINQKKSFICELKHGDTIDFENGYEGYYYVLANLDLLAQIDILNGSQAQGAISRNDLLSLNSRYREAGTNLATRSQQSVEQTIYHSTTDLPGQMLFKEQLATTFALARRHQNNLGMMLVSLADSHAVTMLLKGFAERVQSCLRSGDLLAHWQAETLAVLLPQIRYAEDAAKVSQRIVKAFADPLTVEKQQVLLKGHVGIAVYPQDADTVETLTQRAEVALRRAQEQAMSNYQFYCSEMTVKTIERFKLAELLKQAIEKNELALHYQPQLNLKTQEVTGVEAFLRWHHPEVGQVSPATFVALAEEMNLTLPIATWTLQTACAQNKAWQQAGFPPVRIGVNLSLQQFQPLNLVKIVKNALQKTGLEPRWLTLEVTEATIFHDVNSARQILRSLHHLGVGVTLDDFGTGYFSLGDLKAFSLGELKIAQSLVQSLERDCNPAIVKAVIAIGEAFRLRVIAEGVETAQQLEILQRLRCQEMQGYHFSKPLGTEEMTAFFHRRYSVPV